MSPCRSMCLLTTIKCKYNCRIETHIKIFSHSKWIFMSLVHGTILLCFSYLNPAPSSTFFFHPLKLTFFFLSFDAVRKWMFPCTVPLFKTRAERTGKKTLLFLNKFTLRKERKKNILLFSSMFFRCDSVNRKQGVTGVNLKLNDEKTPNSNIHNNNIEIQLFNWFAWNALCGFLLMNQLEIALSVNERSFAYCCGFCCCYGEQHLTNYANL